jgi:protein phosphatase
MLKRKLVGQTDIGRRRENNEDAFVVSEELGFCLATDGMGGAAAGEMASRIFVETTVEVFTALQATSQEATVNCVRHAFGLSNHKILTQATSCPENKGMGCTAELLAFHDDGFVLGHVGDSRTYRFRRGRLEQLTEDHTLVQQQFAEGLIDAQGARSHPLRNVILRAVGLQDDLSLDLLQGRLVPEDIILLCSDGLSDMLTDEQISDVLATGTDISTIAATLIERANAAGGDDNITVVMAAFN